MERIFMTTMFTKFVKTKLDVSFAQVSSIVREIKATM